MGHATRGRRRRPAALAATALVDQLATLPADATLAQVVDLAQDVAAAVFGDGFLVVPVLAPGSGADPFAEAVDRPGVPAAAPSAVRRFVRDVATVRPQVSRLSEALLLEQALGRERRARAWSSSPSAAPTVRRQVPTAGSPDRCLPRDRGRRRR